MKPAVFNVILKNRIARIKSLLETKATEYVKNSDRLYNFKRASEILRTTKAQALMGMATKHLVSVLDLVEASVMLKDTPETRRLIDEKIGDAINYFILLEAILLEEITNEKS